VAGGVDRKTDSEKGRGEEERRNEGGK